MRRDRGGFTLVEMLMVTVLGALVLAAAVQVLITNQQTYTAQTATISGQQSTRMALEVLFTELRLVSPRGGDILMMSQDSLRVQLMRKFSRACAINTVLGVPEVTVVDPGNVDFIATDSVWIFADNNQRDDDDDVWFKANIQQVVPGVCPQDLSIGLLLRFPGQNLLFTNDSVRTGAPVRSYQMVRYAPTALYGDTYLGRAVGTAPLTPVAGPLQATGGVQFTYRDALGAVTGTAADVRQIVVRVRSGSGVMNSLGETVSDSITAWVYTRN